ncbi:MAG: amidohydrolase family protein [Actinomycetota bacterium]
MAESPVVDIWVNLLPPEEARRFLDQEQNRRIEEFFGSDVSSGTGAEELLALMDALGVGTGVLTGAVGAGADMMFDLADRFPGRLFVSAMVDQATRPTAMVKGLRELAQRPRFVMVRVVPLVEQHPINSRLYYPVYAACEELGLPVAINVGVPGPLVRSRCQDPVLLEDVLIDFPDLVVIGAHMGHPYERLLIQYMMKWPNLYLSTTAYSARYMDEELVRFMGSSRGHGKVLFGSDHPFLPLPKALDTARALPLSEEARAAFLGGTAARLLSRDGAPDAGP